MITLTCMRVVTFRLNIILQNTCMYIYIYTEREREREINSSVKHFVCLFLNYCFSGQDVSDTAGEKQMNLGNTVKHKRFRVSSMSNCAESFKCTTAVTCMHSAH